MQTHSRWFTSMVTAKPLLIMFLILLICLRAWASIRCSSNIASMAARPVRRNWFAMLGDGAAAIAAAGLAPEKVIAFGRSIGSLYAIELAHRHPETAGLIIESGIADAGERFLTYADLSTAGLTDSDVLDEVKRHFNHEEKLSRYRGPLLILHTEHDGLIDISHAERNLEWAASSQKRLVRFSRGDHNSIMAWNQDEYFTAVHEFAKALR